jgi:hypothetical protein
MELDVRDILAAVRVPTLVIPHPRRPGPGQYIATRIRGAQVAELPPLTGIFTWVDDEAHRAVMAATAQFVAQLSGQVESERVLATVLFTDIVGSTERAAALGDSEWRQLLERHHAVVRRELARFQGRELDTAGDGFFAAFDGPARAVLAAAAIRDSLRPLELEIRAGLHTGECEVSDGNRRHRRVHRRADRVSRRARGDPRLEHREGSRRRLEPPFRAAGRASPQRRPRPVAPLRT